MFSFSSPIFIAVAYLKVSSKKSYNSNDLLNYAKSNMCIGRGFFVLQINMFSMFLLLALNNYLLHGSSVNRNSTFTSILWLFVSFWLIKINMKIKIVIMYCFCKMADWGFSLWLIDEKGSRSKHLCVLGIPCQPYFLWKIHFKFVVLWLFIVYSN